MNAKVPRKLYTFQSNPKYTPEDMFTNENTTLHALHNWIELSSGTFLSDPLSFIMVSITDSFDSKPRIHRGP